jgi:ABC-2 type transport system permease protein
VNEIANIAAVARREYTVRIRTRSFLIGTVLLVIGVSVIALLPVITSYIDRHDAVKVALYVAPRDITGDPAARLTALLNPPATAGGAAASEAADYVVTTVPDLTAGRQAVAAGTYAALLGIDRAADGDLAFTLYTNDPSTARTAQVARQAATNLAVADRLSRHGIAAGDQAALFAPAAFEAAWADPAKTVPLDDNLAVVGQDMLAFGMTILIFMMIVMYGNWIAMSVVEEKSSRVMEVVLNAATPFQLLTGKVFGVGAVAFTQYAAIVVTGVVALLLQDSVATAVLGSTGTGTNVQEGLTIGLLVLFGVYGVLGFLMFAVLYAAAGSLISRQEDVNAVGMPMTLVSTAGYMVGTYAALGLFDIRSGLITGLAQVPLLSPFMMLGRITKGVAAPWEIVLSVALLVVFIACALWLASRIYAAGVLLYGQRPGVRAVVQMVREGM